MSTARVSALSAVPSAAPSAARSVLAALLGSGVAGLAAFALDLGLARLTLGHALPLEWIYAAVYAGTGLAIGGLLLIASALGPRLTASTVGLLAFAGVYALPVAERVHHVISPRSAGVVAVLSILGALIAYGAAGWALWRLSGSSTRIAAALLGLLTALGLAVNRDLVTRPFEPAALAADAALLAAIALAAWALGGRAARLRTALAALAAAACVVVAVFVVLLRPTEAERSRVAAAEASTGDRANLLLVVIDTLRGDVFDAAIDATPEGRALRDRLGSAAYFNQAVAAAPWTAPSVGSILTGLYPQEHGFGHHVGDPSRPLRALSPRVPTLAGRLANRGYRTHAIVTNPLLHADSGIGRGFERFELLGGTTTKLPLLGVVSANGLGWLDGEPYQPAPWVRRRAVARLDELAAADRPFFLYLHFMDPHEPLHAHPELPPLERPLRVGASVGNAPIAEGERLYVEETRLALREIASIVERLEALDRWRETVFVLVSDHGEMFPGDRRRTGVDDPKTGEEKNTGHGHALFDELVRVPLVIRPAGGLGGGIDGPRRLDVLVSHVDLHDTIVDLLGVDVPAIGRDRISVAGRLVRGGSGGGPGGGSERDARRRWTLLGGMEWGSRQRGLRTPREKIIVYEGHRRDVDRFDLGADPAERRDLVRGGGGALRERLDEAWAGLDDGPSTAPVEVDAETRRRLEALGYVQ